jgi:hypothetical protein
VVPPAELSHPLDQVALMHVDEVVIVNANRGNEHKRDNGTVDDVGSDIRQLRGNAQPPPGLLNRTQVKGLEKEQDLQSFASSDSAFKESLKTSFSMDKAELRSLYHLNVLIRKVGKIEVDGERAVFSLRCEFVNPKNDTIVGEAELLVVYKGTESS